MSSNAPPFDPLNPSKAEDDDMFEGYRAALRGELQPPDASFAFAHGYRMARNDRANVVDADQAALARRYVEEQRQAGRRA